MNCMTRPYILQPWQQDAMRELIDALNCINNGYYSGPEDLSGCLERTAESLRLALDTSEFNDQIPPLLNAIVTLHLALNIAVTQATAPAQTHQQKVDQVLRSAIAAARNTPGDQQRDLIHGVLHRIRNLTRPGFSVVDALEVSN